MSQRDISSMRSALEFLRQRDDLFIVKEAVDPVLEIAGIQKALEGGPALLFDKVTGYHHARYLANVFSRDERMAAIFGEAERKSLKHKYLEAMDKPIPPILVERAPSQEVVITNDINIWEMVPLIRHTEHGPEHLFAGAVTLARSGNKGSDVSFKRMNWRGKDWGSLFVLGKSHLGYLLNMEHKGDRIPLTINICPPPSVMVEAAATHNQMLTPYGTDELAIAGGLQGYPVEICRAKTVDAWSIANSECVIEGYLTPEVCWESDEAARLGKSEVAPFFPEGNGYMGMAGQANKFEATAITHRKDAPIFFSPLGSSYDVENLHQPSREAIYLHLARRIVPGLVLDVNMLHCLRAFGVIFQVRKTEAGHDALIKNLLVTALTVGGGTFAVAVDEDIDIYSADDLWWALWTRANHESGIYRTAGRSMGRGIPALELAQDTGLVIDATMRFAAKGRFERAHYPVDKIDLSRWFTKAELNKAVGLQSDYARVIARIGG